MAWLQRMRSWIASGTDGGESGLECPVCRTGLKAIRAGSSQSVLLDACPTCNGLWFDAGELDQLDGSPWANVEEIRFLDAAPDHERPHCPRCRQLLKTVSPADDPELKVDRCEKCRGYWLDRGEFERMQQLAATIDRTPISHESGEKPAGWSDLRWRMHLLRLQIARKS